MKARQFALQSLALLAGAGFISAAAAQHTLTPDQIKFGQNPTSPSQISVLYGKPTEPGLLITRVRYTPGLRIMPHSHPVDTVIVVLSGTLAFAEGEKFEEAKLQDFPAGSHIVLRANVPHYYQARSAVDFQAAAIGPSGFRYVDPKDDPRNK